MVFRRALRQLSKADVNNLIRRISNYMPSERLDFLTVGGTFVGCLQGEKILFINFLVNIINNFSVIRSFLKQFINDTACQSVMSLKTKS